MSTIVNSIDQFRKHVTVSFSITLNLITPYVKVTERTYIKYLIGEQLYTAYSDSAPTEGKPLEVYNLLEEAISNIALMKYTKYGLVDITDNGLKINSTNTSKPAEWWQVRDLRRELLNAGMSAIDESLKIMEANEAEFTGWENSEGYTDLKEFFIRKTQDFQRYYNIENSRFTFLKLRPHLLKVEDKYFKGLLGNETLSQIKTGTSLEEKEALRLCQAAQVSLVISEIANEGTMLITPMGLFTATEEIQGEKKRNISEKEMYKLHRAKLEDGQAYLKNLINLIKNNESVFEAYAEREAKKQVNPAYNTDSTLSL